MKKVLITGGSGTVGSSFIKNYYDDYKFYSYSRNEKMQVSLKRSLDKVELIMGSVEDRNSLLNAYSRVKPDIVIHAAAMKHVDTGEKNPIQTTKVNVVGSLNVINASLDMNVPVTVAISTDKACLPDSVYGHSKLLMEKMFLESNNEKNKFAVCRFGNVTHSHGSVLPFWIRLRAQNKPLQLTSKKMNRLMFSQKDAVSLVKHAVDKSHEDGGFILSKKMKTVNMYELASVMSDNVDVIGLRPGEKLNETLINQKELPYTFVHGDYIFIRNYINKNGNTLDSEYSSLTAEKMNVEEIIDIVAETDNNLKKSLFKYGMYG
tara:strand:+ start:4205 stop:5161 length:957 start_codon:yes stop_codon:yes gene_type:complete